MGSVRTTDLWFTGIIVAGILVLFPAIFMRIVVSQYLYTATDDMPHADAVLVLGASVARGELSTVLKARADAAIALYKEHKADVILMTGTVEKGYDEVTPVRDYLLSAGIPTRDIALDKAGEDTFTSMYRARNVFLAHSLIIVTQDFHLPRAVYIARTMGTESYGLAAPRGGKIFDYLREVPASWKALFDLLSRRAPPYASTPAPLVIAGIAAR